MKRLLYYSVAVCVATSSLFYSCGPDDDGGEQEDPKFGTFTDSRDNKTYTTVKIGDQTWLAENLNYRSVNEGTVSCYDATEANCDTHGALYDFEAAQAACPEGWHLPSDEEWKTLEKTLGMTQAQVDSIGFRGPGIGTKLKVGGDSGIDLTLSGEYQLSCQCYANFESYGTYWTSTSNDNSTSYGRTVTNSTMFQTDPSKIGRGSYNIAERLSVRCIKNN